MSAPEEVAKLISESGNNFHAKVARWLQTDGWRVTVSPYYMDQTLNKAREIDLVAEKLWPVTRFTGEYMGAVAVRLFVECKFIPSQSHSVFWFTEKDMDAATRLVNSSNIFPRRHEFTSKHHYLAQSRRVAKLFASSGGKSPDNDPYYRALNQVLNAMVSMRGGQITDPELRRRGESPVKLIEFPVVVCSSFSQLYGVDFFADSEPQKLAENFQLEIQYAYLDQSATQRSEHLLLDFVEFDQLKEFVAGIDGDARMAVYIASEN